MKSAQTKHPIIEHALEISARRRYFLLTTILVTAFCFFLYLSRFEKNYKPLSTLGLLEGTNYLVDRTPVTIKNGTLITTESTQATFSYIGKETLGDLNGDGLKDITFILTETMPRGEVFYYLALALRSNNGYNGLNTVYLGDSITPQVIPSGDRELMIHLENNNKGPASHGKLKHFIVRNNILTEILK